MNIFVFGSNLAGRHGAGAAKFALDNHGAIYGQGVGLQGNAYAIPTKAADVRTSLPLDVIQKYVDEFLCFAFAHPEMTFNVTRIGCGYAKYTDKDINPMFYNAPNNVILPKEWFKCVPNA